MARQAGIRLENAVQAVNRIDAAGVIKWVVPANEISKALGIKLRGHGFSAASLEKSERTGRPQITKTFELAQGRQSSFKNPVHVRLRP